MFEKDSPNPISPQFNCGEIAKRVKEIVFHAPGLKRFKTSEYTAQEVTHFASVSVTGTECALACDHCQMQVLQNMTALPKFD